MVYQGPPLINPSGVSNYLFIFQFFQSDLTTKQGKTINKSNGNLLNVS